MERKAVSGIMLTLLLTGMLTLAFNTQPARALDPTTIVMDPAVIVGLWAGDTFQVNVIVNVGSNQLFMWVLSLSWNPSILELVGDPIEGPFLKSQVGATIFLWELINQTGGYLKQLLCCSLEWKTATGSGVVATFTFRAVAPGASALHLYGIPNTHYPLKPLWLDIDGNEYSFDTVTDGSVTVGGPFPLSVSINPDTLNLKSKGKWITAYIEFPKDYNVDDTDISSILLNNTIPVDSSAPISIGDYDGDGIPDLMVKFDRAQVISYILDNIDIEERFTTVTLTITGKLYDGTPFQGSDTIKIYMPMLGHWRFLELY